MKSKSILYIMFLFGAFLMFSACSKDDESVIDPDPMNMDETFPVSPGMYVAQIDGNEVTITLSMGMTPMQTNGDALGEFIDRDGLVSGIMYLPSGNFAIVEIGDDQTISTRFGGPGTNIPLEGLSLDNYTDYQVREDGDPFNLSAGVYQMVFDQQTNRAYSIPIGNFLIHGNATEVGWSDFQEITQASASENGISWSQSDVVLRNGLILPRHAQTNIEGEGGYLIFTFNGGMITGNTANLLNGGGANLDWNEEGTYDVDINVDVNGNLTATFTRTGDAPELVYDPADFNWGIIGPATPPADWEVDTDLTYVEWAEAWVGLFYLTPQEFAFRANDEWNAVIKADNSVFSSNTVVDAGNGNFKTDEEGLFHVKISTPDEGKTWEMTMDFAAPGLIGAGADPVNGWDGPDIDLPLINTAPDNVSWKIEGHTFQEGEWKIRMNDSWEVSFGYADLETIEGANASLLSDSNTNIGLSTAGAYTLTLTTKDGGRTFTMSFD